MNCCSCDDAPTYVPECTPGTVVPCAPCGIKIVGPTGPTGPNGDQEQYGSFNDVLGESSVWEVSQLFSFDGDISSEFILPYDASFGQKCPDCYDAFHPNVTMITQSSMRMLVLGFKIENLGDGEVKVIIKPVDDTGRSMARTLSSSDIASQGYLNDMLYKLVPGQTKTCFLIQTYGSVGTTIEIVRAGGISPPPPPAYVLLTRRAIQY